MQELTAKYTRDMLCAVIAFEYDMGVDSYGMDPDEVMACVDMESLYNAVDEMSSDFEDMVNEYGERKMLAGLREYMEDEDGIFDDNTVSATANQSNVVAGTPKVQAKAVSAQAVVAKMQLLPLRRHLRKRHKHSRFLLTTIRIPFTITLSALSRPGKNSVIACKIWKLRKSSTLMMMICSLPILTWTRCRLTSSLGLLTTPRCLLAAWRRLWAAVLMQCCPLCAARKAQGLPLKSANVLFRLAFRLSMA